MKIVKNIFFSLFLLVSLAYLFIIVSPKIFKGFYPFGIKTAVVLTGSMEPNIKAHDFVILKKVDEVNVGDIVSYKTDNLNADVLHRVISIKGDEVITKGDANNINDDPININDINGLYIGKIKYLGSIILFISKPIVFTIIVTGIIFIMFFPFKKKEEDNK